MHNINFLRTTIPLWVFALLFNALFSILTHMDMNVEGRCMKCKTQRAMKEAKEVKMKTGMRAAKGACSVCGTGMYKILGK